LVGLRDLDRCVIRDASDEDLPAIVKIYNHYVETSTATFDEEPQSLDQRREWFRRHGCSYPVLVAELNGVVVGWAAISPFSDRPAYRLTVEDSVYVHSEFTGRGVGSQLMQALISRAQALNYHCIVARIAEENEGSVRLHERFGFRKVGTMEEVGYKFGHWLNVTIMMLSLDQSSG
jgi:L-amino acid N-acyltransferase YncA